MHGWPAAATVWAAIFIASLGALVLAPAVTALCGGDSPSTACDASLFAARSLAVGSGALLAAALVAGLYAAILARLARPPTDARPLVHVRRRRW